MKNEAGTPEYSPKKTFRVTQVREDNDLKQHRLRRFPALTPEHHHNYTCMVKWLDPGFFFTFHCASLPKRAVYQVTAR